MSLTPMQQAVQEGRVLRAVKALPNVRPGSTILGSVKAHTVQRGGETQVLITREEGWYLTPAEWQKIAEGLHLESGPAE